MPRKLKTITNRVVNKQDINSVSIDTGAGIVSVEVELSRHTDMPADSTHPNPYTRKDNKAISRPTFSSDDLQPELDKLLTKIDTIV